MKNGLDGKSGSVLSKKILNVVLDKKENLFELSKNDLVKVYEKIIEFVKEYDSRDGEEMIDSIYETAGFDVKREGKNCINVKLRNQKGISDYEIGDHFKKEFLNDEYLNKIKLLYNISEIKNLGDLPSELIDENEINSYIDDSKVSYANSFFDENEKIQEILKENSDFMDQDEEGISYYGRGGGYLDTGIKLNNFHEDSYSTFGVSLESLEEELNELKSVKKEDFNTYINNTLKEDILRGGRGSYLGSVLNGISSNNNEIKKLVLEGSKGFDKLLELYSEKLGKIYKEVMVEKKYVEEVLPIDDIYSYLEENIDDIKVKIDKKYKDTMNKLSGFDDLGKENILKLYNDFKGYNFFINQNKSSEKNVPHFPYFGSGHKELMDYLLKTKKILGSHGGDYGKKLLMLIGEGDIEEGSEFLINFYYKKIGDFNSGVGKEYNDLKEKIDNSYFNYKLIDLEEDGNHGLTISGLATIKEDYKKYIELLNSRKLEDVIKNIDLLLEIYNKSYQTNIQNISELKEEDLSNISKLLNKFKYDQGFIVDVVSKVGYDGMDKGNYLAQLLSQKGYINKDNIHGIYKKLQEENSIINQFGPYLKEENLV